MISTFVMTSFTLRSTKLMYTLQGEGWGPLSVLSEWVFSTIGHDFYRLEQGICGHHTFRREKLSSRHYEGSNQRALRLLLKREANSRCSVPLFVMKSNCTSQYKFTRYISIQNLEIKKLINNEEISCGVREYEYDSF